VEGHVRVESFLIKEAENRVLIMYKLSDGGETKGEVIVCYFAIWLRSLDA